MGSIEEIYILNVHNIIMERITYSVMIERDENGMYVAKMIYLPCCATEGKMRKADVSVEEFNKLVN